MRGTTITFEQLLDRHRHRLELISAGGEPGTLEVRAAARAMTLLGEGRDQKEVARDCGMTWNRLSVLRQRFLLLGLAGLTWPAPIEAKDHSRHRRHLSR
jgi:hypothetical protein